MRAFTAGCICFATPALAHHEVVFAASVVPLVLSLATVLATIMAAWRVNRKK